MSGRPHALVVRLDSDGDVLLAGPAVRAVAASAGRVTLLAGPRGRQAAAMLPGVDEVLVWRSPWIDPEPEPIAPRDVAALIDRIAALDVDVALVLGSFHQSPLPTALVLRLAGVARIGAVSEDYPGSLLDLRHRVREGTHEVDRSLSLAAAMGFPLPAGDWGALAVRRDGDAPIIRFGGGPSVVVHPGASVPARAWAPERHATLVRRLAAAGRRPVVTGGPDEVALTRLVAGEHGVDLGGATSFPQLAEVLAGADVVVVGNTGPAHLAAAVGCPVVSLFAPTVPAASWRPWRVPQRLLGFEPPCAGCRARICPVPGHPCIDAVGVDEVLDAVEELAPRTTLAAIA